MHSAVASSRAFRYPFCETSSPVRVNGIPASSRILRPTESSRPADPEFSESSAFDMESEHDATVATRMPRQRSQASKLLDDKMPLDIPHERVLYKLVLDVSAKPKEPTLKLSVYSRCSSIALPVLSMKLPVHETDIHDDRPNSGIAGYEPAGVYVSAKTTRTKVSVRPYRLLYATSLASRYRPGYGEAPGAVGVGGRSCSDGIRIGLGQAEREHADGEKRCHEPPTR